MNTTPYSLAEQISITKDRINYSLGGFTDSQVVVLQQLKKEAAHEAIHAIRKYENEKAIADSEAVREMGRKVACTFLVIVLVGFIFGIGYTTGVYA